MAVGGMKDIKLDIRYQIPAQSTEIKKTFVTWAQAK
jgi:hypothetical protein